MDAVNAGRKLSGYEIALGFGVLIFLFFAFGMIFYLTATGKIKQSEPRRSVSIRRGSGPTFSVGF